MTGEREKIRSRKFGTRSLSNSMRSPAQKPRRCFSGCSAPVNNVQHGRIDVLGPTLGQWHLGCLGHREVSKKETSRSTITRELTGCCDRVGNARKSLDQYSVPRVVRQLDCACFLVVRENVADSQTLFSVPVTPPNEFVPTPSLWRTVTKRRASGSSSASILPRHPASLTMPAPA